MKCAYCGTEMEYGLKFCPDCGRRHHSVEGKTGKAPGQSKRSTGTGLLTALVLLAVVASALWFWKPWELLPMPGREPAADDQPATDRGAGKTDVDALIAEKLGSGQGSEPELTPEQQAEAATTVNDTLARLWDAEKKQRYRDVFRLLSVGIQNRLEAYYPEVRISTPADYIQWRNEGAYEPQIQDIKLMNAPDVKGARATVRADATVLYGGKTQPWEYDYVLIKSPDGTWRVDGLAAGAEAPPRALQTADLDEDGDEETIAFLGNPLHRTLRWEVVESNGAQAYVFEMQACEAPPGAGPDQDPFARQAAKPILLVRFGEAESKVFAEQFPMWKDASELNFALQSRRIGFLMQDGCAENMKYFVLYFKGGYRVVVF